MIKECIITSNTDEAISSLNETEKLTAFTLYSSEKLKFMLSETLPIGIYNTLILNASLFYEYTLQKMMSVLHDDLNKESIDFNFKKTNEILDELISTIKTYRDKEKKKKSSTKH